MHVKKLIVVSDACCQILDAHLPGRARTGKAACGSVYLKEEKKPENKLEERGKYLGEMTVPESEYSGLIFALDHASEMCRDDIEVWLDNELVVKHLTGKYKLKAENLKPLFDKVKSLENRYKNVTYYHHSRNNVMAQEADKVAHEHLKLSQG